MRCAFTKNNSSKKYRIKYDKYSMSIVRKAAIVFTLIFIFGIILTFAEIERTELIWLFSLYIGGGVSVACYVALGCSIAYFARLKKHGYVIPENRKDYDNRLENLPRESEESIREKRNSHSRLLSNISLIIFGIFLVLDIRYYVYWKCQGESAKSMFVMCLLFYMVWIFFAVFTRVQCNPEKYRDDVEIDDTRKERTNIEQGIFVYIVFFLLSLFANATANSMTNYIFQEGISEDLEQARMYQGIFENAMDAYRNEEGKLNYKDWENTFEQLKKGVDITTWGIPSDALQQSIADSFEIDDFAYLKGDFKSADGDAQIFVQYVVDGGDSDATNIDATNNEGRIVVKLLNSKKEVAKRSRKAKEIMAE